MGEVWKHQGPGMWTCGCGSPRHRVRRRQRPGSSAPAVHPLAAEPVNHNHPIRYVTHDRSLPFVPAKPLRTSAADAFVPCRPSRCALALLLPCRGTQRVRQRLQMPHSLVFTRSSAESSRGASPGGRCASAVRPTQVPLSLFPLLVGQKRCCRKRRSPILLQGQCPHHAATTHRC